LPFGAGEVVPETSCCEAGSLAYFLDMTPSISRLRTAAVLGLLAVALGAFGAHGLESQWKTALDVAEAVKRVDTWKTASHYHIAHAIVLLILAFAYPAANQGRFAWRSFVGGIVLFSGSLYVLAFTGIKTFAYITPIGGVLLILGWLLLAFQRPK
jgi:uncharacterized membrane protein YgdD (TMEM256/DUF423 family)